MAEITLSSQEIRGKRYGVGRCTVHLGNAELNGVAVLAGEDRHISTEEAVCDWLTARGLSQAEAKKFVRLGLLAWDEQRHFRIKQSPAAAAADR